MAIALNGLLGPTIGKVGPVTTYLRNGVPIIRTATRKADRVHSPARIAQREKLKICNQFTHAFTGTDFFKKSFPPYGHTGSGFHRATSAIMNRAIVGSYPHFSLSFPDILVSKGPLPGAVDAHAVLNTKDEIVFSWVNNSETGTASPADKSFVLVFDIKNKQILFTFEGNERAMQSTVINAQVFKGQEVATWLSFINEKGDVADSVFCGLIEMM